MTDKYPSADYKALLRGEITPEEYVQRLKAVVDSRLRRDYFRRFRKRLRREGRYV